jgi:uncharacterized protein YraI
MDKPLTARSREDRGWITMNRSTLSIVLVAGLAAALFAGSPPAAAQAAEQPATVKTEGNLRAAPTTTAPIRAVLPAGTAVTVMCWARGEPTYGSDKYGSMWLYLTRGGWMHSFLVTPVDVKPCGEGVIAEDGQWMYKNCDAARAAGAAPVYRHELGYGPHLDRDNDGVGCEWWWGG